MNKKMDVVNVAEDVKVSPKDKLSVFKNACERFKEIKAQITALDKEAKKYKSVIDEYMDYNVNKDTRNHRWYSMGDYYVQRQCRVATPELNEDYAKELFESKGVLNEVAKEVIEYEYDGEVIARMVSEGIITEEEFNILFPPGKVTYATCIITKAAKEKYDSELASGELDAR